jgi:hypothetical protein
MTRGGKSHEVNLLLGRSNKKYDKMVSAIEKARKALRYLRYRKIEILDAEHTEFLPVAFGMFRRYLNPTAHVSYFECYAMPLCYVFST